jgi:hypothetical protein
LGAAAAGWPLFVLAWGWADVIATTLGTAGSAVFGAFAALGVPLPGQIVAEPHANVPAFGWWLAGSLVAVHLWRRGRWAAAWLALPLLGAALGAVARPAAVALAIPAFCAAGTAVLALYAAARRRGDPRALREDVERAALLGVLALALALRWWGFDEVLSSDAIGYEHQARIFHQQVAAAGTNPIARFYLDSSPAPREPLFSQLVRLCYDLIGESTAHLRYVSLGFALASVWVTYRFGKATLGAAAGLVAALLLAVEPWHILSSHPGLREETAGFFVYALATLVVLRRSGGAAIAVAAGLLAAAAVLTRIESAAVVGCVLLVWSAWHGAAWRRTLPAYAVGAALTLPLLVGFALKFGDFLAPIGMFASADQKDLVAPLTQHQGGLADVVALVQGTALGTGRIYAWAIFGAATQYLDVALGPLALPLVAAVFVGALAVLIWRGPRLPAALAVLGCFLPPYAFIAGRGIFSERYSYLVLTGALVVLGWGISAPLAIGVRRGAGRWFQRGGRPGTRVAGRDGGTKAHPGRQRMDGFEWGQTALGANTPEELQRHGVNVFFAPNVKPTTKVVNLADGRIGSFQENEHRPKSGYYAEFDSLVRYCERNGAALLETDGAAIVQGTIQPSPVAIAVEDLPASGRPDRDRAQDLRAFATAFDARQYLPELAAWMSDDALRQVRIWKAARFDAGKMYFDLDNPERGPFVASGDEGPIVDHTYACRDEVMEDAWAQLVTWRQPVSADQGRAISATATAFAPSPPPSGRQGNR